MRCPCCGAIGATPMSFLEGIQAQIFKISGLVAFMGTAIVGQSDLVGEPWKHWITVAAFVAATLVAWNIKQHPVKQDV